MARNAEVIRQWTMLRAIESSRLGLTIPGLAEDLGVTTRTIRRDLAALQEVGFPIYDEERDGRKYWRLDGAPLRGLERSGFTLAEACALYFSRSVLETLAGSSFRDDLGNAFNKIAHALPPAMRAFLDRLPGVVGVKPTPRSPAHTRAQRHVLAQLLDASLHHRRVAMRYHSVSSSRTKDYVVEPHQVVYGHGALYLLAFVPEYAALRTFAVSRVERLRLLEDTFEPADDLTREVFPHSLGIHQGEPTHVVLAFSSKVAPYVRERTWHPSQRIDVRPDGGVLLSLDVCDDWALRNWILGFGALVRVVAPRTLAEAVLGELEDARRHYAPPLELELPRARLDRRAQRLLPFRRPPTTRGPAPRPPAARSRSSSTGPGSTPGAAGRRS